MPLVDKGSKEGRTRFLCDRCQVNAAYYYVRDIEGEVSYLCVGCAKEVQPTTEYTESIYDDMPPP